MTDSQYPVQPASGVVGVSWHAGKQKWRARIKHQGKRRHVGYFDSLEDAAAARRKAEAELDWDPYSNCTTKERKRRCNDT